MSKHTACLCRVPANTLLLKAAKRGNRYGMDAPQGSIERNKGRVEGMGEKEVVGRGGMGRVGLRHSWNYMYLSHRIWRFISFLKSLMTVWSTAPQWHETVPS